jgi:adenylyl-sulfate kinase
MTTAPRAKTTPEGFTLWLTGLPCAGKTTLGRLVAGHLRRCALEVELLDGDIVRTEVSKGLGFDKESRDENLRRIGFICRLLSKHRVAAIVAAVSPYRALRDEIRATLPHFVEIFVKASLQTCISRDVKGLYKKALASEISNFTGVNDPYEPPISPELIVETDYDPPGVSAARILSGLRELRLIEAGPVDATSAARKRQFYVRGRVQRQFEQDRG